MKTYNYNPETFEYVGEGLADPDPLEPGNWLIPGNSVVIPPPLPVEGKTINYDTEAKAWVYKDIPPPPPPPEANFTYKDWRRFEYPDFGEYLDGIVKGDQAQIDDYIAKCKAVKAKYPKE
jgi:hypothetical protein